MSPGENAVAQDASTTGGPKESPLDWEELLKGAVFRSAFPQSVAGTVFYLLGRETGRSLGRPRIKDFVARLEGFGLGRFEVGCADNRLPIIRIYNCISCSTGRPAGQTVCHFQAGLLAGGLEMARGEPLGVAERRCGGLGHDYCEFHAVGVPDTVVDRSGGPPLRSRLGLIQLALSLQSEEAARRLLLEGGPLSSLPEAYRTAIIRYHADSERGPDGHVFGTHGAGGASFNLNDVRGVSTAINEVKAVAVRASKADFTVLLEGESGTGKELFAHAIHNLSRRASHPFITVNCSAIPENLLEAELFGYEGGSFTGARRGGKPGKCELADGGTLFLDEVGDLPLAMQPKLLRLLQYGEIEKIGATSQTRVDVRVIAATNKNLLRLVETGAFRDDLYYRLNVINIQIPPCVHVPRTCRCSRFMCSID